MKLNENNQMMYFWSSNQEKKNQYIQLNSSWSSSTKSNELLQCKFKYLKEMKNSNNLFSLNMGLLLLSLSSMIVSLNIFTSIGDKLTIIEDKIDKITKRNVNTMIST